MTSSQLFFNEPSQQVPVVEETDVVVCGSGPAGIGAALAAARTGARTVLLEVHGCLGGVWTSGLLSWLIDGTGKPGIMKEIIDRLDARQARLFRVEGASNFAYDIEQMKRLLEEMMLEAGVRVRLHTRVVAVGRKENSIDVVLTESKSGRQAWRASCFVDASGDGDLAAMAGCDFDCGHPETGESQPMSLLALLTGVEASRINGFIGGSLREPKERLLEELTRVGAEPSYSSPTLFMIRDGLYTLMANHEYGVSATDADQISEATIRARAEVNHLVDALRSSGEPWTDLRIVATAEQIGVREGRRIAGLYTVSQQDLIDGVRHQDAICRVHFGIDVHSTNPAHSKNYDPENVTRTLPYDIPLRALIAKDIRNLLLAGRCISGDFIAHSSYRVTGNAVATGQGAGVAAALSAKKKIAPQRLPWPMVKEAMDSLTETSYFSTDP